MGADESGSADLVHIPQNRPEIRIKIRKREIFTKTLHFGGNCCIIDRCEGKFSPWRSLPPHAN